MTKLRLPAGTQPYDALIGLRVGTVAGGLLAAIVAIVFDATFLAVIAGALVGGAIGFLYARKQMRRRRAG